MEAKQVVDALAALAHEHRLAIYRMLVEVGPAGMAAGAIAESLGVAPSSLSFHVQALTRSGLVTQRRASRHLIYAADFGAMNGLLGYLSENCCGRNEPRLPVCDPATTVEECSTDSCGSAATPADDVRAAPPHQEGAAASPGTATIGDA